MTRGKVQMEAAGLTPVEAEATAASESGPALSINTSRYRYALDYLHAINPETGADVVFVPGGGAAGLGAG